VSAVVRLERPDDRRASLRVEKAAFSRLDEAAIVGRVRDEPGSFALVAIEDDEVVGHVQMSRAWIGSQPLLALGPIAVLPDRQGRGIGSALVREALQEARRRDEVGVMLLGSPDYYPRFGFRPGATWGLRNPFTGVQESGFVVEERDFMLVPLTEPEPPLSGEVRWHPAFGPAVEAPGEPR